MTSGLNLVPDHALIAVAMHSYRIAGIPAIKIHPN
jgi:hypothetical protein